MRLREIRPLDVKAYAAVTGQHDAILIVDGVFLNRPELAGLWNYSIWLTTPLLEPQGDEQKRNVESDEAYLRDANPSEKATTLIDNRELDHPRRVFADSC